MVSIVDNTIDIFKDIIALARKSFDKWKDVPEDEFLDILEVDYANGGLDWLYGKHGLVAFVRYEVVENGRIANIFDLAIYRGEKNSYNIIRFFVARGWVRFPSLRYIRFERELHDNIGVRAHKIQSFFNGGNNG